MSRTVRVSAPSRLHFGLIRFEEQGLRSFGGLGMMIDRPRTEVELSVAPDWDVSGRQSLRAEKVVQQALKIFNPGDSRRLSIRVADAPLPHVGLGSGTQLALALAAGIHALGCDQPYELEQLVGAAGRGGRSAVGSHGFQQGGLIWEVGKGASETLGKLHTRVAVPLGWRIVLVRLPTETGISGEQEAAAFGSLPPVPPATTQLLCELAEAKILPAALAEDFQQFASGVYDYGVAAGNCFASVQGGPFATSQIETAVHELRSLGVEGVGQSSWGPTIFACCENETNARQLVAALQGHPCFADAEIQAVAPDNVGCRLEILDPEPQQPDAEL